MLVPWNKSQLSLDPTLRVLPLLLTSPEGDPLLATQLNRYLDFYHLYHHEIA